jgi:hypothetical protein
MKALEYKRITGLAKTAALVNEETRARMIEQGVLQAEENKRRGQLKKFNQSTWSAEKKKEFAEAMRKASLEHGKTMAKKNQNETCPLQLVHRIRKQAEELGRTPTMREAPYSRTAVKVYGSWDALLRRAGMERDAVNKKNQPIPEEDLLEMLREFKKREQREPSTSDCKRNLLPHKSTFSRKFGSFKKAKELAYNV